MKQFLFIFSALLLGATSVVLAQKNSTKSETVTTVFDVQTMHGDHCKKRIEGNIAYEKGVKDLQVDLKANTVTITYDSQKISEKQLIAAFEKLGYKADAVCPHKEKAGTPPSEKCDHESEKSAHACCN